MGVTLLRITIVMLVLSWATVVARLSVRRWLKPEAMGLDDHMMCLGLVCVHQTIIPRERKEGILDIIG